MYNAALSVPSYSKYCFRLRTRDGVTVERIQISASSEKEATNRLRQIYRDCEILSCTSGDHFPAPLISSFESIVDLISN